MNNPIKSKINEGTTTRTFFGKKSIIQIQLHVILGRNKMDDKDTDSQTNAPVFYFSQFIISYALPEGLNKVYNLQ